MDQRTVDDIIELAWSRTNGHNAEYMLVSVLPQLLETMKAMAGVSLALLSQQETQILQTMIRDTPRLKLYRRELPRFLLRLTHKRSVGELLAPKRDAIGLSQLDNWSMPKPFASLPRFWSASDTLKKPEIVPRETGIRNYGYPSPPSSPGGRWRNMNFKNDYERDYKNDFLSGIDYKKDRQPENEYKSNYARSDFNADFSRANKDYENEYSRNLGDYKDIPYSSASAPGRSVYSSFAPLSRGPNTVYGSTIQKLEAERDQYQKSYKALEQLCEEYQRELYKSGNFKLGNGQQYLTSLSNATMFRWLRRLASFIPGSVISPIQSSWESVFKHEARNVSLASVLVLLVMATFAINVFKVLVFGFVLMLQKSPDPSSYIYDAYGTVLVVPVWWKEIEWLEYWVYSVQEWVGR